MAYTMTTPRIGVPDVTAVMLAGALGAPGITGLPSVTTESQLGELVWANDFTTYGTGQFIFLAVPVSTAITPGLLYQWDKNYNVVLVPAISTSKNTGVPVALAVNTVASNASTVQYTWFLVQGQTAALKTAVAVVPQSPIYISATAGRIKVLSSAGGSILGGRSANTATVTSTTSTVTVYLNFSSLEGA